METIKYEHGVTALQFDSRKVICASGENGVKVRLIGRDDDQQFVGFERTDPVDRSTTARQCNIPRCQRTDTRDPSRSCAIWIVTSSLVGATPLLRFGRFRTRLIHPREISPVPACQPLFFHFGGYRLRLRASSGRRAKKESCNSLS